MAASAPNPGEFGANLNANRSQSLRDLNKLFQNPDDDLQWYYEVGQKLHQIYHRDDEGPIGAKFLTGLAQLLGLQSSAPLYKKLRFATEFSNKELEELRLAKLSWTHVVHASTERDKQKLPRSLRSAGGGAAASGWPPSPDFLERVRGQLTAANSPLIASMLGDIERWGQTEADHVLGDLIRRRGQQLAYLSFFAR